MPGTYGIFMWLIFFPCLQVCTESLLFGTQQKEVSCAQHDLVWPIKWKWISSLHIKFCWIPFAQESKITVSCSSMLIHFLSDSHISLFPQILKFLLAAALQIPHSHKWALHCEHRGASCEPGTEVPSCGEQAGRPWDKQSPCRAGPAPLHTPEMVLQEGWYLPGASSSHCLTHSLSLLLKGSCHQCAKDTAASSFYSPHSTNLPPFQQKPQGPHAAQIPILLVHGWWISPCSPHVKYSMDLPSCVQPPGLNPSPGELWSS